MAAKTVAVLVSGGLDSDVLLGEMTERYDRVVPIYIRQGLAWEKIELYWLNAFIRALKNGRVQPPQVFDLPMQDVYKRHWSLGSKSVPGARTKDEAVYLPGRNLILIVKAAVFCAMRNIPAMALGSLGHNPFPDASRHFFDRWQSVLGEALSFRLKIMTPYRSLEKAEVIRRGKLFPLEKSFSCLAPKGRFHCGRCNKCAERKKAFRVAGVQDRTFYA